MAATGDLRNNIGKVQAELKPLQYTGPFDASSLSKGDPTAFLPLIHFIILESDPHLARHFASKNHILHAKRDGRFIDSVYKLLRDEFGYKPVLSREQFFSNGFAERKLLFIIDLAKMCKTLREELARSRGYQNADKPRPPTTDTGQKASPISLPKKLKPQQTQSNRPDPPFSSSLSHQRNFNPANYSSNPKDILHELENQSESEYPHHTAAAAAEDAKHQIKLMENMPYRTTLYTNELAGGSLIPLSARLANGDWVNEGEGASGLIIDHDFDPMCSETPSYVFPTGRGGPNGADISTSMLHESPLLPPNPSAHPMSGYQPPQRHGSSSSQPHRRSILKPSLNATTNLFTEPPFSSQPPLHLHDLQPSPQRFENDHQPYHHQHHHHNQKQQHRQPSYQNIGSPDPNTAPLLIALDMSTSATSGSRSLNHGVPGTGTAHILPTSPLHPSDTAVPSADQDKSRGSEPLSFGGLAAGPNGGTASRIEAARNRWNSAGSVIPVVFKNGAGNGNGVAGSSGSGVLVGGGASLRSGGGGLREGVSGGEWGGGRRSMIQQQTQSIQQHQLPLQHQHQHHIGEGVGNLEAMVGSLLGVVNKLLDSHQSIKEDITALSERLARVEVNTDAVVDRLSSTQKPTPQLKEEYFEIQSDLKSVVQALPDLQQKMEESEHHVEVLRNTFRTTQTYETQPEHTTESRRKLPQSHVSAFATASTSVLPVAAPAHTISKETSAQNNVSEKLIRGKNKVESPLPSHDDRSSGLAGVKSTANAGAFGRGVSDERPTGEYIKNIEERLKATSELLKKAKKGYALPTGGVEK